MRTPIKLARIAFCFLCLGSMGMSCSKVLSERTDEGAWLDYRSELAASRSVASLETAGKSPAAVLLRKELEKSPIRTFLLKCGVSTQAQTCFDSEMTRHFDGVFRKLRSEHPDLAMADYRLEQKAFLKSYSYSRTLEEVERFHQTLLSGIDLKSREAASDLFKLCDSERPEDSPIDRFDLFSGGVTEFPKGVYSCIEKRWETEIQSVLDENLDRLGLELKTSEARIWIRNRLLSPVFEAELTDLGKRQAAEELKQFEESKAEIFKDFDSKKSEAELVKTWAPRLREKFPYSPVEQWVSAYQKKKGL